MVVSAFAKNFVGKKYLQEKNKNKRRIAKIAI